MRTLPALPIDDEIVYDRIVSVKQEPRRGRLKAIRASVFTAYLQYEAVAPDVEILPDIALTGVQRDDLLHAYSVDTAPMLKLRERLLKRVQTVRCPFCGLSESSTLDHYLPKDKSPQFSVFSKNLVPCCPTCNVRKLSRIVDENTKIRLFLHPYFDVVPDMPFVKLALTLGNNSIGLRFGISRPIGMKKKVFNQLQSHFRLLDLADRYRLMSLEHLRGQHKALLRIYRINQDPMDVGANLKEKAIDIQDDHGMNYWLAVLYRTLAEDRAFCDGGFEVLRQIQ